MGESVLPWAVAIAIAVAIGAAFLLLQGRSTPRHIRFTLYRGNEPLGTVALDAALCDFPWYGGRFTPAPAFAPLAPLFAQELQLLDAEDMDAWGAVWREIEGPGIRLVPEGGEPIQDLQFHIEDGAMRWRA